MAIKRHLDNAPIREALIDIRCPPVASLDTVAQFASSLVKPGDQIADLWEATMEVKLEQGQQLPPTSSHTASLTGKRIDFADRRDVVQLKTTGCTYSRLAPYETWEAMTGQAFEVWGDFVKAVPFEAVERIAVRYVNSIQLPLPILDFATYLTCPPVIPQGLPQEVGLFVSRVSFNREGDIATVTQMIESGTTDGKFLNVLVDIEVATMCNHQAADADGIRTTAKRLREFKNDVFFGFVTDPALERYA